jgi:perosamine synthetase
MKMKMQTPPGAAEALADDLVAFVRQLYATDAFIPLHVPILGKAEAQAVAQVVESGMISTVGECVGDFEAGLVKATGAAHAIATINGTAALHLALKGVGVGPGDEVITQALTFVATANAVRYCGADPVFIDVDLDTMGLSADAVEAFLAEHAEVGPDGTPINGTTGRPIRACLPMHTNGHPGDMERLGAVCERWGLPLVEDAAEALGSYRNGRHAGLSGRCATLSFNGNKIISTGQGGAIITDDAELARRLRHLAATAKKSHPWRYEHDEIGYNYRLPALNAALGVAQLDRLPELLASKREIAQAYIAWFEARGLIPIREPENASANFWFNAFLTDSPEARDTVLARTNAQGVMTRPLWDPLNTLPPYKTCQYGPLPNTQWLYERLVNVPSTPRIS